MTRLTTKVFHGTEDLIDGGGRAEFFNDNGVVEITLPEWSGFLNRATAHEAIARLRTFCDLVDAALVQADQAEKAGQSLLRNP